MVIQHTSSLLHWNYFLAIDSDVENLSRYIDFDPSNYNSFSIEMAHLMLASASEVDVVAKLICKKIKPSAKAEKIAHYRTILKKEYPNLSEMKILMPRFGLTLKPWINWKNNKSPDWWKYYNKVKHGVLAGRRYWRRKN